MKHASLLATLLLWYVCGTQATSADAVILLRNGSLSIPYPGARPRVAAAGFGVDLNAVFDDGTFEAESCRPCLPGSVVSLRAFLTGTALGSHYFHAANFTFEAGTVQVPTDGSAEATLVSPFTFEGGLSVSGVREPAPGEAALEATLSGTGTATVHLVSTLDPQTALRLYFFHDITYRFNPRSGE